MNQQDAKSRLAPEIDARLAAKLLGHRVDNRRTFFLYNGMVFVMSRNPDPTLPKGERRGWYRPVPIEPYHD